MIDGCSGKSQRALTVLPQPHHFDTNDRRVIWQEPILLSYPQCILNNFELFEFPLMPTALVRLKHNLYDICDSHNIFMIESLAATAVFSRP